MAMAGLLAAGFHGPALAQAKPDASLVVDYGGVSYSVETYGAGKSYNDASNIINSLGLDFKKTAIWKRKNLAESIAAKVDNIDPNKYAFIAFPWDEDLEPFTPYRNEVNIVYTAIGSVYSASPRFSDTENYTKSGWAVVNAIPKYSINPPGNINGNNKASNLGKTLLPQLEGGILTVDQTNQTYSQDFTLSGSFNNTIDNDGNQVVFAGIFSDATSTPGNIAFSPNGNPIEISGRNTYSGITVINGTDSLISSGGAIPDS